MMLILQFENQLRPSNCEKQLRKLNENVTFLFVVVRKLWSDEVDEITCFMYFIMNTLNIF